MRLKKQLDSMSIHISIDVSISIRINTNIQVHVPTNRSIHMNTRIKKRPIILVLLGVLLLLTNTRATIRSNINTSCSN